MSHYRGPIVRTLVVAYLSTFLNLGALFCGLPLFQEWLLRRSCTNLARHAGVPQNEGDIENYCMANDAVVSKQAGDDYAWLMGTSTGVAFLTSAILTSITDYIGRKSVLVFSAATTLAIYIGWTGVSYFQRSVYWFVPFHAISGIGGGMSTTLGVTFAIVADVTTPAQRSVFVAGVLGCVYVAGMVGPLVGGAVAQHAGGGPTGQGYTWAFATAGALQIMQIVVLIVALPESLPTSERLARPRISLRAIAEVTIQPAIYLFKTSWATALIGVVYTMQYVVIVGSFSIVVFFAKLDRFGLSAEQVGRVVFFNSVGKTFAVFVALPLIVLAYQRWAPCACCRRRINGEISAGQLGADPRDLFFDDKDLAAGLVAAAAGERTAASADEVSRRGSGRVQRRHDHVRCSGSGSACASACILSAEDARSPAHANLWALRVGLANAGEFLLFPVTVVDLIPADNLT